MASIKKNAVCPCGSGLKYKKCCLGKEIEKEISKQRLRRTIVFFSFMTMLVAGVAAITIYSVMRPGPFDSLAKCLTSKGYQMYGTHWCPNCKKQKSLFGKSFKYIDYIECSPNGSRKFSDYCTSRGIKKVPTWVTPEGGQRIGVQTIMELQTESTCFIENAGG